MSGSGLESSSTPGVGNDPRGRTSLSTDQETQEHDDFLIDFLQATAMHTAAFEPLLGALRRGDAPPRYYRQAFTDERGVIVASGGKGDRDAILILGGRALANLRRDMTETDIVLALGESQAVVTRMDIARDTSGSLTPHYLYRAKQQGRLIAPGFKAITPIGFPTDEGLSVYFGSSKSEVQLRVYNRTARLRAEGYDVLNVQLSRWELALRGNAAKSAFQRLCISDPVVDKETGEERIPIEQEFFGILMPKLRIAAKKADKRNHNQSRGVTAKIWRDFMTYTPGNVPVVESRQYDQVVDFRNHLEQVVRQTASGVALIERVGGQEALQRLVAIGRTRIKPVHLDALQSAPEASRAALQSILDGRIIGEALKGHPDAG